MAIFDYRNAKLPIVHNNKPDSSLHVEVNETLSYGNTYWQGYGTIEGQDVSFRFTGKNMTNDKLKIKKAYLSSIAYGNAVFSKLSWRYRDFEYLTTKQFLKKTCKGNDRILGGRQDDILDGEEGNDKIYGKDGDDKLIGGKGNDRLYGGSSDDKLIGGNGNDRLYGGSGDDVLVGGSGKNYLSGQGGRDTFKVVRGKGYDIIKDFTDGEDLIQLGNGAKGLKLSNRGNDMLIHQRGDLLAIVKNASGDLQLFYGNYLV